MRRIRTLSRVVVFSFFFLFSLDVYGFESENKKQKIISHRTPELQEHDLHHPDISPDGKYIAFTSSWNFGNIWVQEISTGKTWPVTKVDSTSETGDVVPRWSPDSGKLFFTSDRGNDEIHVFIVNLDGTNLTRVSDKPVSLRAEGGWVWDGIGDWMPDGKSVIYPVIDRGNTSSILMKYELSSKENKIVHSFPDRIAFSPNVSPDGKSVIYVKNTPSGNEGLEILDLITETTKTVSCNINNPSQVRWSPDGKWLGFQVNEGSWKAYILPINGGTAIRVGLEGGKAGYTSQVPSWTGDGKSIVYHGKKMDTLQINVRDLETSDEVVFPANTTSNDWYWASWSDNEKKLALIAKEVESSQGATVSVLEMEKKSFRNTTLFSNFAELDAPIPNWKSKIAGWTADNKHFVGIVQQAEYTQLALVSGTELKMEILTESMSVKSCPVLSSDKELIAYLERVNDEEDIWIYDLVTNENYQITFSGKDKWELSFSPSGDRLLFCQNQGETLGDVMIADVESGEITSRTAENGWQINPAWLDEKTISYTSHTIPDSPERDEYRYLVIQNLDNGQIKTIKADTQIFLPMWHAQSQTFLFNNRPNNDSIIRTNMNGELTKFLEQGYDGILSPSGKYLGYIKRVGEQQRQNIWKENIEDLIAGSIVP